MKILLFSISIFFCIGVYSQYKFELNAKVNNLRRAETIYLFSIKGSDREIVDSSKFVGNKFSFKADTIPTKGEYEILWGQQFRLLFVIANENKIEIELDELEPNLTPKAIISDENKIYFAFSDIQFQIDNISKLGNYLYKKGEYRKLESLRQQLKGYELDILKMSDSISEIYPNSFALKIFKSSIPPDFNEYNDLNPNDKYADELKFMQRHFFDNIDKHDSNLVNTSVIYNACSFYLRNITAESSFEGYKKSADFMLSTFSLNNKQFDYVLELLLNTFESANMGELYLYLVDTYTQSETCEGGIPNDKERKADNFRKFKIGDKVPELSAKDRNDNIVNLSDFIGKPVLIMFWSSYCSHCKESIPEVLRIAKKYEDKDLVFLNFSLDTDKDEWLNALLYSEMPEPAISDFAGYDGENAIKWCIWGTPTFIIIDKEGLIVAKPITSKQLEEGIIKAIK